MIMFIGVIIILFLCYLALKNKKLKCLFTKEDLNSVLKLHYKYVIDQIKEE